MKRILFAWQLGANYGHLACQLPIAEALRSQGHHVSFAVRDPRIATEILHPAAFSFLQTPLPLERNPRPSNDLINYSDLLLASGFDDELTLRGLMECWTNLLAYTRPDVIVADHAPMALLAAYVHKVRAVSVGSGFCVPPKQSPFPSIRPWEKMDVARLQRTDQQLLEQINTLLMTRKRRPLASLAALFNHCPAVVLGLPELDPYGPRSDAKYAGLIEAEPNTHAVDWDRVATRRVFAYLRPTVQRVEAVLAALEDSNAQVICVMPGASQELKQHFENTRVRLFSHRVPLSRLLSTADLVVTYGGATTITQSLFAGVPLLVVPQVVEQYLNALCVEQLGVGLVAGFNRTEATTKHAMHVLLNDDSYRRAAQRIAARYKNHDQSASIQRIASLIIGGFDSF